MKAMKILGALALLFVIVFVGSAAIYHHSGEKGYSMNDEDAIVREISRHLKDPSSAIVNKLLIIPTSYGTAEVCGSINGRNSYGAYVGDQLFSATYTFETKRLSYVAIADNKIDTVWVSRHCSDLLEKHQKTKLDSAKHTRHQR